MPGLSRPNPPYIHPMPNIHMPVHNIWWLIGRNQMPSDPQALSVCVGSGGVHFHLRSVGEGEGGGGRGPTCGTGCSWDTDCSTSVAVREVLVIASSAVPVAPAARRASAGSSSDTWTPSGAACGRFRIQGLNRGFKVSVQGFRVQVSGYEVDFSDTLTLFGTPTLGYGRAARLCGRGGKSLLLAARDPAPCGRP